VDFSLECEARSRRTLKKRRKRLFGQVTQSIHTARRFLLIPSEMLFPTIT